MTASVVERLTRQLEQSRGSYNVANASREDVRALLAVVEAANTADEFYEGVRKGMPDGPLLDALYQVRLKLDALYTPDSAESKDAEGAKP